MASEFSMTMGDFLSIGSSAEADTLAVDFLAYVAIKAYLDAQQGLMLGQPFYQDAALKACRTFDVYIHCFKKNHPKYMPPTQVQFRVVLLRFLTLFTNRFNKNLSTPTKDDLARYKAENLAGARAWAAERNEEHDILSKQFDSSTQLPVSPTTMQHYRNRVIRALGHAPLSTNFYGTNESLSLQDLLPIFLEMLALRAEHGNGFNMSPKLMHLVGHFMLLATLEQYLIFGATGSEAIQQAFCWGYIPLDSSTQQFPDRYCSINELFRSEDDREVPGWQEIRTQYRNELMIPQNTTLVQHFDGLALRYSIVEFEKQVSAFLDALAHSVSAPVLVQLQGDVLEGLSVEQTRRLKQKVGLI